MAEPALARGDVLVEGKDVDDLAMFSLSKDQASFADTPSPSNGLYAAFCGAQVDNRNFS